MGGNTRNMSAIVNEALTMILKDDSFITKLVDKVCDRLEAKLAELKLNYEVTVAELIQDNKMLRDEVDNLEQYSRRNCLRVFGVKEEVGENTEDKVREIFSSKLCVKVEPSDIDRCHRVGKLNAKKSRPIIIKLVSYKTRATIIRARKLLKGTGISIKEDLTNKRLELLNAASTKYGIKNAWSFNGNIYVNAGDSVKRILNIEQLQ